MTRVSKTASWTHQEAAQTFLDDHTNAMLAAAMGTGKSKIIVDRICNDESAQNVLILCPKSVMRVWPREFRKHGAVPMQVIVLDCWENGRKAQAVRYMEQGVFVVNYESAWRPPLLQELCSRKWDYIVCDESQKIKAHDSKVSNFVTYLTARHKYCLTGTPTPNGPLDIYGQFRFLDKTVFGDKWLSFKHSYAITSKKRMWTRRGWIEFEDVSSYKNMDNWADKVSSISLRIDNDVLALPDPILTPIEVELTPSTRKRYNALNQHMAL